MIPNYVPELANISLNRDGKYCADKEFACCSGSLVMTSKNGLSGGSLPDDPKGTVLQKTQTVLSLALVFPKHALQCEGHTSAKAL